MLEDSSGNIVKACKQRVSPGSSYISRSSKLTQQKTLNYDLLAYNHPSECRSCFANGDCSLQTAYPEKASFQTSSRKSTPGKILEMAKGFFVRKDFCIGCQLCVSYSNDFTKTHVFKLMDNQRIEFNGSVNKDYHHNLVDLCPSGVFFTSNSLEVSNFELGAAYNSICVECDQLCELQVKHSSTDSTKVKVKLKDLLCNEGRLNTEKKISSISKEEKPFNVSGNKVKVILPFDLLEDEIKEILVFLYKKNIDYCFFRPNSDVTDHLKKKGISNLSNLGPYFLAEGLSVTIDPSQYNRFLSNIKNTDHVLFFTPEILQVSNKTAEEVKKVKSITKVTIFGTTSNSDALVKSFYAKQGTLKRGDKVCNVTPSIVDHNQTVLEYLREVL